MRNSTTQLILVSGIISLFVFPGAVFSWDGWTPILKSTDAAITEAKNRLGKGKVVHGAQNNLEQAQADINSGKDNWADTNLHWAIEHVGLADLAIKTAEALLKSVKNSAEVAKYQKDINDLKEQLRQTYERVTDLHVQAMSKFSGRKGSPSDRRDYSAELTRQTLIDSANKWADEEIGGIRQRVALANVNLGEARQKLRETNLSDAEYAKVTKEYEKALQVHRKAIDDQKKAFETWKGRYGHLDSPASKVKDFEGGLDFAEQMQKETATARLEERKRIQEQKAREEEAKKPKRSGVTATRPANPAATFQDEDDTAYRNKRQRELEEAEKKSPDQAKGAPQPASPEVAQDNDRAGPAAVLGRPDSPDDDADSSSGDTTTGTSDGEGDQAQAEPKADYGLKGKIAREQLEARLAESNQHDFPQGDAVNQVADGPRTPPTNMAALAPRAPARQSESGALTGPFSHMTDPARVLLPQPDADFKTAMLTDPFAKTIDLASDRPRGRIASEAKKQECPNGVCNSKKRPKVASTRPAVVQPKSDTGASTECASNGDAAGESIAGMKDWSNRLWQNVSAEVKQQAIAKAAEEKKKKDEAEKKKKQVPKEVVEITDEDFVNQILKGAGLGKGAVLVEFALEKCPGCVVQKKVLDAIAKKGLTTKDGEPVTLVRIVLDKADKTEQWFSAFAEKEGVANGVPALVAFQDGKRKDTWSGPGNPWKNSTPKEEYLPLMERLIADILGSRIAENGY